MKNCLILGSGRSGTSMLAGILHQAGYFMGEKFHQARDSNPKGFFEWYKINRINESILAPFAKNGLKGALIKNIMKKNTVDDPGPDQRWLMALPLGKEIEEVPAGIEKEMRAVLHKEPFCYKDPRFSYTLPVWEKILKADTVFICVFREPDVTVNSILHECRTRDYLASLHINRSRAFKVWLNIYSRVLFEHAKHFENLIFVHYNQVFSGSALPMLSKMLGVPLKKDFVDEDLKRTVSGGSMPGKVKELYRSLCEAAKYIEE